MSAAASLDQLFSNASFCDNCETLGGVGPFPTLVEYCVRDCNNEWRGTAVTDDCGVSGLLPVSARLLLSAVTVSRAWRDQLERSSTKTSIAMDSASAC